MRAGLHEKKRPSGVNWDDANSGPIDKKLGHTTFFHVNWDDGMMPTSKKLKLKKQNFCFSAFSISLILLM